MNRPNLLAIVLMACVPFMGCDKQPPPPLASVDVEVFGLHPGDHLQSVLKEYGKLYSLKQFYLVDDSNVYHGKIGTDTNVFGDATFEIDLTFNGDRSDSPLDSIVVRSIDPTVSMRDMVEKKFGRAHLGAGSDWQSWGTDANQTVMFHNECLEIWSAAMTQKVADDNNSMESAKDAAKDAF